MPDSFPLTEEAKAAVEMLGVRNVEDEWAKFRGHHIAKGTLTSARGFYALFTGKWAIDARRIQSRERGRSSPTETVLRPPTPLKPLTRSSISPEHLASAAADFEKVFGPIKGGKSG